MLLVGFLFNLGLYLQNHDVTPFRWTSEIVSLFCFPLWNLCSEPMKWTLILSYCLRVSLLFSACVLVTFDSWVIALAILPVLVLDFLVHRTSTRKVMMGLFVVLLVVQTLVLGILGIKFMLFEDEESFFLESLKSPDTGHDSISFVEQMKSSYTDISSGNIASGVHSLRDSASRAIVDRAKSAHHSLVAVDKTLGQYLHVTDLINLFGDKGAAIASGEEIWSEQNSSTVIRAAFGELPDSTFTDLRRRSATEVRSNLAGLFSTLPATGFSDKYLNPCWETPALTSAEGSKDGGSGLHCMPGIHLLGQPKSGTTDLYSRLSRHHDIHAPKKKEVGRVE